MCHPFPTPTIWYQVQRTCEISTLVIKLQGIFPFSSSKKNPIYQNTRSNGSQYVCMVITHSKSKDQPSKVANPARGQLNREMNISLSPFAPENLVSRDGFGSSVPRQPAHPYTQAESGAVSCCTYDNRIREDEKCVSCHVSLLKKTRNVRCNGIIISDDAESFALSF